jgi:Fe-S cluster assembly iron-binding protein IscA
MTTLGALVTEQERELREKFREMSKVDVNTDLKLYIDKAKEVKYLLDAHIDFLETKRKFG